MSTPCCCCCAIHATGIRRNNISCSMQRLAKKRMSPRPKSIARYDATFANTPPSAGAVTGEGRLNNDKSLVDVDQLLSDFGEHQLKTAIQHELGTEFLASVDPQSAPAWPVRGVLFGEQSRVILGLTVKKGDLARSVFFVLDTRSPFTYLSSTTMRALGLKEPLPRSLHADVQGLEMVVYASPKASGLNFLGSSFLTSHNCQLHVDYSALVAELFQ